MDYMYNSIPPLRIKSTLCSLGLNPSIRGTKHLIQLIEYILKNNKEIKFLDNIYYEFARKNNLNPHTLKSTISYALNNRNRYLAEKNFKVIVNYEYDESFFEPKIFIELFIQAMVYLR